MTKKKLSPLATDLIEALHEVYDDVTGRKRLLRYPRRLRITDNLSGTMTINDEGEMISRLEHDQSMFIRCMIHANIPSEVNEL
jgi:hypothetical protein